MRRTVLSATAVTAAIFLAGCSSGGGAADERSAPDLPELTEPAPVDETPVASTDEPETNDRGNIVKALGEEGGTTTPDGDPVMTFAVDAITPDIACTEEYAPEPENGHLTAIQFRVATKPGVTPEDLGYASINAYNFKFIGSDGLTFSNVDTIATYGCLDRGAMFPSDQLRPGSQYAGTILLDLPEPSGTIVYAPSFLSNISGWEWNY